MTIDQIALTTLLTLNTQWGNPVDHHELKCMAHAIYHEAATDSIAGKVAIANTIMNRVEHNRFPETICDVVKQPYQFSYLNTGNRNHLTITNHLDHSAWESSVIVALTVAGGYIEDTTGGATHYLNKRLVRRIPHWYNESQKLGKFGEHHFVRLYW